MMVNNEALLQNRLYGNQGAIVCEPGQALFRSHIRDLFSVSKNWIVAKGRDETIPTEIGRAASVAWAVIQSLILKEISNYVTIPD